MSSTNLNRTLVAQEVSKSNTAGDLSKMFVTYTKILFTLMSYSREKNCESS